MSFELGERIKSQINRSWDENNISADVGTVVVIFRNGELEFLNDEVKNNPDIQHYFKYGDYMTEDRDVVVKFDDGHYEWGYDGDEDFISLDK